MTTTDSQDRCGLGIRGVAMVIDSGVWFALFFLATFAVAVPTGELESTATGVNASLEGTLGTIAFLFWLSLGIAYHTVFEWRFRKTAGKYLVGIRAVNADGSSLSLRSALVRNGLRIVDFLPLFYVLGAVILLLSDRNERIGDRVANTAVIRA